MLSWYILECLRPEPQFEAGSGEGGGGGAGSVRKTHAELNEAHQLVPPTQNYSVLYKLHHLQKFRIKEQALYS